MSNKIVIAGGSGFIGKKLINALVDCGFSEIIVLSRKMQNIKNVRTVLWDGKTLGDWTNELENTKVIINLSGKSINTRFTPKNKLELLNSRLFSTKIIGKAIKQAKHPPEIWIQAGAIGYYGDSDVYERYETHEPGTGFLADMCINWESIFNSFTLESTRKVLLRIGFVIDKNEGGFPTLVKMTKNFLGGHIGSGISYMSWIHIDDLVNIIIESIDNYNYEGTINAVAPAPVSNKKFMKVLRKNLGRPWVPPAPVFLVKLISKIFSLPAEVILNSNNVVPQKLKSLGFEYKYKDINSAIKVEVNKSK